MIGICSSTVNVLVASVQSTLDSSSCLLGSVLPSAKTQQGDGASITQLAMWLISCARETPVQGKESVDETEVKTRCKEVQSAWSAQRTPQHMPVGAVCRTAPGTTGKMWHRSHGRHTYGGRIAGHVVCLRGGGGAEALTA